MPLIVRLLGDCALGVEPPSSAMLPSGAGRKRPAISRNSEDFPDPFGPTKANASA